MHQNVQIAVTTDVHQVVVQEVTHQADVQVAADTTLQDVVIQQDVQDRTI